MARRAIRTDRLIAVLGAAVLGLGLLVFWVLAREGLRFGPEPPTPEERAQAQLVDHIGRSARVVYTERGKRMSVCGYARIGERTEAFVSRPNRIALQSDPLRVEFEEMQSSLCPGFLKAPPRPEGDA